MKKILGISLALMMVFALLTGCAATPAATEPAAAEEAVVTEAPAAEEAAAPAERTVIKFAAQADSTPATQAVVDAYNASQELYTVEWIDMTNDSGAMREQILTSMQAGSSDYDVLSMDVVWAGEFAAAGYIEPIDQMMQADGLKISQFNAGSMTAGNYSAKQYTLPFFPDLGLLYFRKDIVSAEDAAKLVSGDYTYGDLQTMAETYKGQGGTTDGIVFQAKLYEGLVCNLTEYTAGWTDVEGGLAAMKAMVDSAAVPADILNYSEGETHNSFIKGASVFARNWPYQWGMIASEGTITQDVVDVAPLPGGSTVGGWLLGINKNSVNKEGAWDFIKYVATQGQKIMSVQGGYLPGYNEMLSDPEVIAANAMLSMTGFQNALATTISRPVSAHYSETSDAIMNAAHAYLSGEMELSAAVEAINAALAN
ncbi:putative ABC transporter-binding protein [bioreactor metagenome]|uniref:Putative ABC transporter-binding protein n=1 Tax=bioreactor metagenome TaxID=1076179 RepID=A0A644XZB1_9ZZZZ